MSEVEVLQDLLAEAGNNTQQLTPHLETLLDSLLDGSVILDKVAYKVMSAVVLLIKGGILEQQGDLVFQRILEMFELIDEATANDEREIKRVLEEVTSALFCNACSVLQMQPVLVAKFLPYILQVMTRDGSTRFAGYGCVAPLLAENIAAFTPHVDLLLKAMLHFPGEVLSVISQLYKLQPEVFDANIHLLIQLYDQSPAAQVTILHVLHEIGLRNEKLVRPYLLQFRDMCDNASNKDETVAPIQEFVEDKLQHMLQETGAAGSIRLESELITNSTDSMGHSASEDIGDTREGSPNPSIRGALRKRGRMFGRLSRRWFTLDEGSINFYKNAKKDTPSRRIPLTDVVKVTPDTRHPHAFVVQTRSRSVLFSASSDKEKEMWVSAIEKFVSKA